VRAPGFPHFAECDFVGTGLDLTGPTYVPTYPQDSSSLLAVDVPTYPPK
jgi:hypothetical protein